jgi:hypothetical protein
MYNFSLRRAISALTLTTITLLTACGGGGGAGVTPGKPEPIASAQASMTRALKGFNVTVTPFVIPGTANNQPSTIDISVDTANSIQSVRFWNADDYDTASNLVDIVPSQPAPGKWQITWPKQTKAQSCLLMRFTMSSGDVMETGIGDFCFK